MLRVCGLCVAVANATREAKEAADWVTKRRGPDGVIEVIRLLLNGFGPEKKRRYWRQVSSLR